MSITSIYGPIDVECKGFRYHQDNFILRKLWQGTQSLWERAKASISSISHRKGSNTKKGTRQHLKNAGKIGQVLKQKTKNDTLAKRGR